MKIVGAATAGGHLTELQTIFTEKVVRKDELIILTDRTDRTERLKNKTYFFRPFSSYNPLSYLIPILKCIKIFKKEKVNLVVTTGAEIGLVSLISGKFLGIKTVYIDAIARPKMSLGGRFSYLFSDVFLVQYPELTKHYGRKTKYVGGII